MIQTYNPKLGDANRYENALDFNKELAKDINREALLMVNNAEVVLQKVEANPQNKYSHNAIAGSQHIGGYLLSLRQKLLNDLYSSDFNRLEQLAAVGNAPKEVIEFVKRLNKVEIY